VCAKYYGSKFPNLDQQKKFESELFRKTRLSNTRIEGSTQEIFVESSFLIRKQH